MMTRREAIEALEYLISGECTDTQMDYVDEIEMAITDMKICDANNAGWISVKDRPPDDHEPVSIYSLANGIMTAIYTTSGQWVGDDGYYVDDVTHWMPLPEPPKEET